MNITVTGDCRETMRAWATAGVRAQMCVTSPPYFGLRSYGGGDAELGKEATPDQYIANMVEVFRCVRDVLADDGTLWLNIGDSYARTGGTDRKVSDSAKVGSTRNTMEQIGDRTQRAPTGLKDKDLIGIPWRLAFALQADGWYLRQDIIWSKPNPMPESVRDRCTKAHEYIFLLSKSERYFYDHEAIKEPVAASTVARLSQPNLANQAGSDRVPGKTNGNMKAVRSKANSFKREGSKREQAIPGQAVGTHRPDRAESEYDLDTRNRRSVWTVATRPYKGAHFATFPPALIEPCILAGSRVNDIVLDPFMGSGTTAAVALQHGRQYLGCELNPAYQPLQDARIATSVGPLFA